jgi:hypothetical protein
MGPLTPERANKTIEKFPVPPRCGLNPLRPSRVLS